MWSGRRVRGTPRGTRGRLRRKAWLICLVVVGTMIAAVPSAPSVAATTRTFTGWVDTSSKVWQIHQFSVTAPAQISAVLDWVDPVANLNLFMYAPGGSFVKGTGTSTKKPETITLSTSVSGTWKVGVKAASGSSNYTLTVQVTPGGGNDPGVDVPFITLLFSRSQWAAHDSCQVAAGSVTLEEIAADVAVRGWTGTGTIVTSQPPATGIRCIGDGLEPSWDTLARIHRDYRWEFVSHSQTAPNMTTLSNDRVFEESCGSLPILYSHGFDRAWGLFAYPVNRFTTSMQSTIVSTCFAFGRQYVGSRNLSSTMAAPWLANAWSVNGGACNDSSRSCYSLQTPYRYVDPGRLASFLQVRAGEWSIVQFYALVTGAKLSGSLRWDCTSPDWRQHFTSKTEVYCWTDYQRALAAIPADAVVTDPATVAQAWGSNPQVLADHP
jgi:hypothetical protein